MCCGTDWPGGLCLGRSAAVHERVHSGAKPFTCSNCDQRFARACDLSSHRIKHLAPEDRPTYICQYCGNRYTRPRSFQLALRLLVSIIESLKFQQDKYRFSWSTLVYKVLLSPESTIEVQKFAQFVEEESGTPLRSIQTAVKRFIVRYLVNFDTSVQQDVLHQMLADRIVEPSLWPETMWCEDSRRTEQYTVKIRDIISRFPEAIGLHHA